MSQQPTWILDTEWAQLLKMWEDEDYQTLQCVAVAYRHSDTLLIISLISQLAFFLYS